MAPSSPSRFARLRSALAVLLRWSLWLALAAALVLQLRVLAEGGLRLPAFAQESISRRLAEKGFSFRAEAVWLDPRGRVLVIAPRLGLAAGAGTPVEFASAHAVALQLRRRELLRGRFDFTRVEITGLGLALPAIHSPTGADQPLLEGGEFLLARAPGSPDWKLEQSSARVLSIPTAFTGALPRASAAPRPSLTLDSALAGRILDLKGRGELLRHAGELMKLIGDIRSELFHYEVRATYDTPEVAESRRIVREAIETENITWEPSEWKPDGDEADPTS